MVKELRLAGVSSMAAANAWLPAFITAHNTRFGRDPANAKDLHRPLAPADDLDEILARREERTVTRNLTLHYDRMMLLLDPTPLARGLVGKKVAVVNYSDGRFAVQFNGTALAFKVFDKIQTVQPGAIVDNKRLSAVLEQIKAQQAAYPARQQRGHIARQRPPNNLEAPGLPSRGRAPRHRAAARLPPEAALRTVLIATTAFVFHLTEMPPAKPASTVSWQGGFFRYRENAPRWLCGEGGLATPDGGSRPVPIGSHPIGVSSTGYSSAGCSPAEPTSASPVADNNTSNPGPARQSNYAAPTSLQKNLVQVTLLVPVTHGCHLYFARRVTFLSCADNRLRRASPEIPAVGLAARWTGLLGRRSCCSMAKQRR